MRLDLATAHSDVDFLEQGAQQLLAIAVSRSGRFPCTIQVRAQSMNAFTLLVSQTLWALMLPSRQFGLGSG